jgi:hypothetical protein
MEGHSLAYNLIYDDLLEIEPLFPSTIPCTYNENISLDNNLTKMFNCLLRALRRKDRVTALANAYYIGQMLECKTSPAERHKCNQHLTIYYRQCCVRIFNLFEPYGIEQVYRTKRTKFWMFRTLKAHEYQELLREAILTMNSQELENLGEETVIPQS